MTILKDELPYTNDALQIYLKEADKECQRLKPYVSQYNKLQRRIKMARERIDKRHG